MQHKFYKFDINFTLYSIQLFITFPQLLHPLLIKVIGKTVNFREQSYRIECKDGIKLLQNLYYLCL